MKSENSTLVQIEDCVRNLGDENAVVRESARMELIALGGDEVVRALIEALTDYRAQVRWEAAKALHSLADPVAADALVQALDDENDGVRWVAAEALIALKETGLRAVLGGLAVRAGSVTFCHSAHHVLQALKGLSSTVAPVLQALKMSQPAVTTPPVAYEACLELSHLS
ncbi:MAG: HEAT repeat domain-containing protein [Planctomycetaceae bacterium]|nr:HEAT repeat domain-containing protein [Planctomycetaceae bacterium]